MADPSIDQQKLPGVREVCRDFAVLEDHSLAHNLQEQEIEHHLASNIQRTRLVQHDLVMAKQLQEEEDLRAQARLKKRHKDLERQDCEIAQEIQEKLVIEADRRRRQEEKDEDIARLLQEKELKEEKKRKKQFLETPGAEDGNFHETGANSRGRHEEHRSDYDRPCRARSGESHRRSKDESKGSQSTVSIVAHEHGQHEHGQVVSERSRRHSDEPGRRASPRPRDLDRPSPGKERPQRPSPPKLNRDADLSRSHKDQDHSDVSLSLRDRHTLTQESSHTRIVPVIKMNQSEEVTKRDHSRVELLVPIRTTHGGRSPSYNERESDYHKDSGIRSRDVRDVTYSKPRADVKNLELDDAKIARRLQEEELRASQEDERAAQVAQDEEIARLFMEREKKAYSKAKACEKASLEKRMPEDWNLEVNELTHSRSRDRHEHHRSRCDKPTRPPPPSLEVFADSDSSRHFESQHSSTRPFSKSQSSPKGSYYRQ